MNKILDYLPTFCHFIHCHICFSWQLNWVVLVDINDHENRVRIILLEYLVDLNIILFNSHTSSIPTNYFFIDIDLDYNLWKVPFYTYYRVFHYIYDQGTRYLNLLGPLQMGLHSNLKHQSHQNFSALPIIHPQPWNFSVT